MMPKHNKKIEIKTSKVALAPVEKMKVTVLVEDSTNKDKPRLIAKHGLSFLLETKMTGIYSKLLMDVGPEPDIGLMNAKYMDLDIKSIDGIFISHGHYDHVGAILNVLEYINHPVPVVAHPEIFSPKYSYKPNLTSIGLKHSSEKVQNSGGLLLLARNSLEIARGVMTSGEFPRNPKYEELKGLWTIKNYNFIKDDMIDEQSLFVNVQNKGLVIFVGCGHPGIINIINHAQKKFDLKIHAIIGGLHLAKSNHEKILTVVKQLSKIDFDLIFPCHCTGAKMIDQLLNFFDERCIPIHTGSVLEF